MTARTDYRAELFYASDDGPFWLSAEAPSGHQRTDREAVALVIDFMGESDFEPSVRRVRGRLDYVAPDGWYFQPDPFGDLEFWEVDDA